MYKPILVMKSTYDSVTPVRSYCRVVVYGVYTSGVQRCVEGVYMVYQLVYTCIMGAYRCIYGNKGCITGII